MFKKIEVIIYDMDGKLLYTSNGKTVAGVMLKIASLLNIYAKIQLSIKIK